MAHSARLAKVAGNGVMMSWEPPSKLPPQSEHSSLALCAKVVGYTAISMARRIALFPRQDVADKATQAVGSDGWKKQDERQQSQPTVLLRGQKFLPLGTRQSQYPKGNPSESKADANPVKSPAQAIGDAILWHGSPRPQAYQPGVMRQSCEGRYRKRQGTGPASSELSFIGPLGGFHMLPISAGLAAMVTAGIVCWFLDTVSTDDSD